MHRPFIPQFATTLLLCMLLSSCATARQPVAPETANTSTSVPDTAETETRSAHETTERVYVQIQYLSVTHAPLIPEILSHTLLPYQQRRVDEGAILNWTLYETLIAGPDDRYRMISITKTTDYNELFREFSAAENYRNLSGAMASQSMLSFHEAINVLYSEVWVLEGSALTPGTTIAEGNYITKNYLDSRGRSGEYRTLELDFWRPIHHKRIENSILNAWGMYTLSKPGGSSRNYNYSTIDYYETLGDVAGFDSREMARLAHPDLSEAELNDFFNRTGPSRTAWKTELWRRITGTSTQP